MFDGITEANCVLWRVFLGTTEWRPEWVRTTAPVPCPPAKQLKSKTRPCSICANATGRAWSRARRPSTTASSCQARPPPTRTANLASRQPSSHLPPAGPKCLHPGSRYTYLLMHIRAFWNGDSTYKVVFYHTQSTTIGSHCLNNDWRGGHTNLNTWSIKHYKLRHRLDQ